VDFDLDVDTFENDSRLSRVFARAPARLIEVLEEQQQVAAAIEYAQLLLRHDLLDEAAYRSLM
jgi:hypothetical protein